MAIAVVFILLTIGSVIFHFVSPWYLTPIASNWEYIDNTLDITFWITGVVFVAVNLFVAFCVVKFRHKKDRKADYEPENTKLEVWLTVITTVGVAGMLTPGLFVWADFVEAPEDAAIVEAVGQQWHWNYRFPGADGELGTVDSTLVTIDNPFGMNPDDPKGRDDVLINSGELHLPLDQPVKMLLRSKDVLHDFAVPQFRVKMDLVPGMITYIWFTPTRTGSFELLCEELCGMAHHAMRGRVVVEEEASFQAWLGGHPTFAQTQSPPRGDVQAGKQLYAVCTACHGAQGEGIQPLNGPKLSGQSDWYLIRQLQAYKGGRRGTHPDDTFGLQMAPMAATLADDKAIRDVVAYIETLPDTSATPTVTGDVARGQDIYETCGSCHGDDGEGLWALNSPRFAGMSDWDLVTQLKGFQQGYRGAHPSDIYGAQMVLMADILGDDEAINDVIAYINTL